MKPKPSLQSGTSPRPGWLSDLRLSHFEVSTPGDGGTIRRRRSRAVTAGDVSRPASASRGVTAPGSTGGTDRRNLDAAQQMPDGACSGHPGSFRGRNRDLCPIPPNLDQAIRDNASQPARRRPWTASPSSSTR